MDSNEQERKAPRVKRGKEEKYIHEDADTILDLADIRAMSSIACKDSNDT